MPRAALPLVMTALLAALLASTPAVARAQGSVRATVTPAAVLFPAPGPADFDAGYIDSAPVDIDVQSRPARFSWELVLRAAAADMGGDGKPAADVLWRRDGAGSWQPLSTADQLVAAGTGDQPVRVYFRVLLDWAFDRPGDYALALTFTALRP